MRSQQEQTNGGRGNEHKEETRFWSAGNRYLIVQSDICCASATLTETVPYTAYAEDNANPGAGADFFSLEVVYTDTPELDQFDLFGSPATFAGTLEAGNVTVK